MAASDCEHAEPRTHAHAHRHAHSSHKLWKCLPLTFVVAAAAVEILLLVQTAHSLTVMKGYPNDSYAIMNLCVRGVGEWCRARTVESLPDPAPRPCPSETFCAARRSPRAAQSCRRAHTPSGGRPLPPQAGSQLGPASPAPPQRWCSSAH
jgi:hypothetical protein